MTITAADLQIFASTKMTDATDGGGPRDADLVQDGVLNTLFPTVTDDDRSMGSARLRKVYPSVLNNTGSEALYGATLSVNEDADDGAISAAVFVYGNSVTTRSQFLAAMKAAVSFGDIVEGREAATDPITGKTVCQVNISSGTIILSQQFTNLEYLRIDVGDVVALTLAGVTTLHVVTAAAQVSSHYEIDVTPAPPVTALSISMHNISFGAVRPYATVQTAGISSGASSLALDSLFTRIVPVGPAATYPSGELSSGVGSEWARYTHGQMQCVRAGDAAMLWDEQATTPSTVANSDTVNTGTTNLQQLIVVDDDGLEIAHFLENGPTPSGVGCSADLAAGTVTFSDVSGYAQPVHVRYRIEEPVSVSSLSGVTATLAANVARTYPSTARLTTLAPLGDLQADTGVRFSQQAWTKVWSDSLIGNAAPTLYSGAVELTNEGAESDRFACIFTTATNFNLQSERFGQIATGSVATDFEPLNPITGEPLFTLFAAGWNAPGVGNVFRFNTTGAYAPAWVCRTVYPSTPAGGDRVELRLRGNV